MQTHTCTGTVLNAINTEATGQNVLAIVFFGYQGLHLCSGSSIASSPQFLVSHIVGDGIGLCEECTVCALISWHLIIARFLGHFQIPELVQYISAQLNLFSNKKQKTNKLLNQKHIVWVNMTDCISQQKLTISLRSFLLTIEV
jgi:hypothetical protein